VDLSGRAPGYRGIAIRCPGCADAMTVTPIDGADVDVCPGCGGLWVDWFDGEVKHVATSVLASEGAPAPPVAPPSALRSEPVATGACPRCMRQLAYERYVVRARPADGHARPGTATGAELLRCEDCAGVFVSRASARALVVLAPDEEPPPSSEHRVLDPLPWQRLIALVKRLLGSTP
jgi:uncharacterized C2H2 Zn-finger protein